MMEINDESNSWKNVSMEMPIDRSIFQGSLNVCRNTEVGGKDWKIQICKMLWNRYNFKVEPK